MGKHHSIVMIGATGAVGSEVVKTLLTLPDCETLTLLGRRMQEELHHPSVRQHIVDVMDSASYAPLLADHDTAICTLGVGQPSKVSKEEFLRTDKTAVLAFAAACKKAGIHHFQLLCSVGADPASRSFYLKTKGELEEGLQALGFERLSLFRPSVILTPTNRYGLLQGLTLAFTRLASPFLIGGLRRFRGIRVERLGEAIARNAVQDKVGVEVLEFNAIMQLSKAV